MNTNPVNVLVIENHSMMREALCLAIADVIEMQSTLQAATVSEALELVQGVTPDIILLALGHAGDGDMDVLSTLRKSLPGTPILALTSNELPGQEQAALDHGAQAVLSKAVARTELIAALRTLHLLCMEQSDDVKK